MSIVSSSALFGRNNPEHAAYFHMPSRGTLMKSLEDEELARLYKPIPSFRMGDTLNITTKSEVLSHIGEEKNKGKKIKSTFTSTFQGFVIGQRRAGVRSSIKILRVINGDRIMVHLPLYAPAVTKIEVVRLGRTRRAKLYYLLQDKRNRKIRIPERDIRAKAKYKASLAAAV